MSNDELVEKVIEIQTKHKLCSDNLNAYIKRHFNELYLDIEKRTIELNKFKKFKSGTNKLLDISIFERIYCLKYNLTDRPKCKVCGQNYVNGFNTQLNEYKKWCCPKCQASDPECISKLKQTKFLKYGDENYVNNDKAAKTRLSKYGSYHTKDFGQKVKLTKFKHFGDEKFINSEKAKETKLLKYGDETYNNKEQNYVSRKTNFYNHLRNNEFTNPLFSLDEYLENDLKHKFKWQCKKCGNIFEQNINYNFKNVVDKYCYVRCYNCYPKLDDGTSDVEKELVEYVKSITSCNIIENDRTVIAPLELDIYIPEKKIAIEFDGLYWHSDENKPRNYHLNKTEMCEKQGIQLIHIFENEWNLKQDIVKRMLKNTLGIYDKTISNEIKFKIKEVTSKEALSILNKNYLFELNESRINLGLFYKNELSSLMTFNEITTNEFEIICFCDKLGNKYCFECLLKYFEQKFKPMKIIAKVDRRWNFENFYSEFDFRLQSFTEPNCWYWKNIHSNLKSAIDQSDETIYHRIFDCGNLVYIKTY